LKTKHWQHLQVLQQLQSKLATVPFNQMMVTSGSNQSQQQQTSNATTPTPPPPTGNTSGSGQANQSQQQGDGNPLSNIPVLGELFGGR
jgi:hypothetical protein